jgi:hypothetical protein
VGSYDLGRIAERVAEIYEIQADEIFIKGSKQQ